MKFLFELFEFLYVRKKFWLAPIIIIMLLFGLLIIFTESSAIAPFIYILFQLSNKNYILGISAYYHDSAACLVHDGKIIAAAQEERFTRKKHDKSFPKYSIDYCFDEAKINFNNITFIGFYDKPFLKFERILETYCHIFF